MTWALLLVPWILAGLLLPFLPRRRPHLRDQPRVGGDDAPYVSVIVPARDEADNIAACMSTIIASSYSRFELIVVDDQSTDGTPDVARALARRSPIPVRVIQGETLPEGWIGKPWACAQGARLAHGDLVAFTDADTRHDDELLDHAVGALMASRTDLISVAPRQVMVGFWEKLLQPHIFALLWLRWRDPAAIQHTRNPRDVLTGGQFMLVRRDAYEAVGGHTAVRAQIAEDVALGQRLVAAGKRVQLAIADDLIETRMYRSLSEILRGWSKNLASGARMVSPRWIAPVMPWLAAAVILALWVLPAVLLVASLGAPPEALGGTQGAAFHWAAGASAAGLFFWAALRLRYRAHPLYAPFFPIGAALVAGLFVRSALLGQRVAWKGRAYNRLRRTSEPLRQP